MRPTSPTREAISSAIAWSWVSTTSTSFEVASVLEEMHNAGKGIVGMKVLGEGRITTPERKDASLRYVLGLGTVNTFIIGFEHTEQIDDLLKRTADAITFLKA